MRVNWKSKIPNLIQDQKKDHIYQGFQDAHKGITAVQNAVESIKINSSDPFGKVDGVNNTFRLENEPAFMVVNGVVKINGLDFNFKNGYIKFTIAPPPNAIIKGFHV